MVLFLTEAFAKTTQRLWLDIEIRGDVLERYTLKDRGMRFDELEVALFGTKCFHLAEVLYGSKEIPLTLRILVTLERRELIFQILEIRLRHTQKLAILNGLDVDDTGIAGNVALDITYPPILKGKDCCVLPTFVVNREVAYAALVDVGFVVGDLSLPHIQKLPRHILPSELPKNDLKFFLAQGCVTTKGVDKGWRYLRCIRLHDRHTRRKWFDALQTNESDLLRTLHSPEAFPIASV